MRERFLKIQTVEMKYEGNSCTSLLLLLSKDLWKELYIFCQRHLQNETVLNLDQKRFTKLGVGWFIFHRGAPLLFRKTYPEIFCKKEN